MIRATVRDRGAADALGLVIIAPFIIGLALLVISLGRGVDARAQVRSAAEAAAQAAALERNADARDGVARATASAMLADSTNCDAPVVNAITVDDPGLNNGLVRVTVQCEVTDRGIDLVAEPFDEIVTAVAPVDFFRADR